MKLQDLFEAEDLYKIQLDYYVETENSIDLHSLHADPDSLSSKNKPPPKETEEQLVTRLAKEFAEQHGCTSRLITLNGPGGGNPLVEFTGPRSKLLALYVDYNGGDQEYDDGIGKTRGAEDGFNEFAKKIK